MVGRKSRTKSLSRIPRTIKDNDASSIPGIIETMHNSLFDITNEIANVQPRYAQLALNFQAEYLHATKMIVQTLTNFQSTLVKSSWFNFNISAIYTDQIKLLT